MESNKVEEHRKNDAEVETKTALADSSAIESRFVAIEEVLADIRTEQAERRAEQGKIIDILENLSDQVSAQTKIQSEQVEAETEEVLEETEELIDSVEDSVEQESEVEETEEEQEDEADEEETSEVVENTKTESDNIVIDFGQPGEDYIDPATLSEEAKELVGDNPVMYLAIYDDDGNLVEEYKLKSEEESEETETEDEETNVKETEEMTEAQLNALKEQIKNDILDAQVSAPEVKPVEDAPKVATNWRKRYNDQVAAAWDALRLKNINAAAKLEEINEYNASIKNDSKTASMSIKSLGNFVLPAEVDSMIHGKRSVYGDFLEKLDFQETDSFEFAFARRVGDINMQSVELEAGSTGKGNLKPVEGYDLTQGLSRMEEFAAVVPICTNATKYLAADILGDVAAGFKSDYDRKLAQLAIVRMQQAVDATSQTVEIAAAESVDSLIEFIKTTATVSDSVVNGTFVFNAKTKALLLEHLYKSGAAGEAGAMAMTGEVQTIFGHPYIVVPNDLMPTLGTEETKTFKARNLATQNIEDVEVKSPVFYGDLTEFHGKTSGALDYEVSAEASYEINGVTRSAWQRNELILRGAFLRGGYIGDIKAFAALKPRG